MQFRSQCQTTQPMTGRKNATNDPSESCRRRANRHRPPPPPIEEQGVGTLERLTGAGAGRWPAKDVSPSQKAVSTVRLVQASETTQVVAETRPVNERMAGPPPHPRVHASRRLHRATSRSCRPSNARRHPNSQALNGQSEHRLHCDAPDARRTHHPPADGQFPTTGPTDDPADHRCATASGATGTGVEDPYP